MSDSVQPHRRQSTRLRHPWDSPGKNTGVGCHFLLQCIEVKSESEVTQSCPTLRDPMDCSPPGSSVHRIFQARVLEWVAIAFSEWRDDSYFIPWFLCKVIEHLIWKPRCTAKKVSNKCPNASCYIPYVKKKKNVWSLFPRYIWPKFRIPSLQNGQKFE